MFFIIFFIILQDTLERTLYMHIYLIYTCICNKCYLQTEVANEFHLCNVRDLPYGCSILGIVHINFRNGLLNLSREM